MSSQLLVDSVDGVSLSVGGISYKISSPHSSSSGA